MVSYLTRLTGGSSSRMTKQHSDRLSSSSSSSATPPPRPVTLSSVGSLGSVEGIEDEVDWEREQGCMKQLMGQVAGDAILAASGLSGGFYLKCLRARSLEVGEALVVARNFLRFRDSVSWPLVLRAQDVQGPLGTDTHWVLRGRDRQGRGIFVMNMKHLDLSKGSVEIFQMEGQYLIERAIENADIQRRGIICIFNMKGMTLRHMTAACTIKDTRRAVGMWRDAFPCKLKAIYIYGAPFFLHATLTVSLALLAKKLRDRVRLISNTEQFEDMIDHSQLPPELGGTSSDINKEEMVRGLSSGEWMVSATTPSSPWTEDHRPVLDAPASPPTGS